MKDQYIRNTICGLICAFLILLMFVLTHNAIYYIGGASLIILIGLQSIAKAEHEICLKELERLNQEHINLIESILK